MHKLDEGYKHRFNKKEMDRMFIILIGFGMLILVFLINYYDLSRFKKCYDNDFRLGYCEKYKNY